MNSLSWIFNFNKKPTMRCISGEEETTEFLAMETTNLCLCQKRILFSPKCKAKVSKSRKSKRQTIIPWLWWVSIFLRNFAFLFLEDGNLYAWGSNESGQMGTRTEIGVEIYETANFPTLVVNDDFKSAKIVDYDIGEDVTAILLDNNEVSLIFFSKLNYNWYLDFLERKQTCL